MWAEKRSIFNLSSKIFPKIGFKADYSFLNLLVSRRYINFALRCQVKSLPAVVVLYFTATEKDNLHTESYSYKEQKLSQCTGKQNCVMKNEKNSDYYYLSNRKMILSKLAGLLFPRKFNKRTSLFTLMRYITAIWFFD